MPEPDTLDPALLPMATAIGEAWAHECASDLRASDRDVVGAWPGTVREALSRVLSKLPAARSKHGLRSDAMQLLARTTYDAARRSWQAISEPDVES
jgi:hypothetical protein